MPSPTPRAVLEKSRQCGFNFIRWAPEWYSLNRLDGETRRILLFQGRDRPLLFCTRNECREYIAREWGYIAKRPDLRGEPHGWRVPRPIRIRVTVEKLNAEPNT